MPLLTGTLTDITGTAVDPSTIRRIYIKATGERRSSTNPAALVTTAPVDLDVDSTLSATVEPGNAVLVVAGESTWSFPLRVADGMTTFSQAVGEAARASGAGGSDAVELSHLLQLVAEAETYAGEARAAAEDLDTALQTIDAAVSGKSDKGHRHLIADITATGTPSSSTYLAGDGSWKTPTNTTYSAITQAEAESSSSTTARLTTGQRLYQAVLKHAPAALATLLEGKSDKGHKHPIGDITATGTPSASTFLAGDGAWKASARAMTQGEADAGTLTATMTLSPAILRAAILHHTPVVRVTALPASPDPTVLYVVVPS